jgi:formylglycine-generating enzyme required for sulfatase activity
MVINKCIEPTKPKKEKKRKKKGRKGKMQMKHQKILLIALCSAFPSCKTMVTQSDNKDSSLDSRGGTTAKSAGLEFAHVNGLNMELQVTEVTQGQYKAVTGVDPYPCGAPANRVVGNNFPVTCVSYNDARDFAAKLTAAADGFEYSIPTKEEWLAAAGNASGGSNGVCATRKPRPVKSNNAFHGFFDMADNVSELTSSFAEHTGVGKLEYEVVGASYSHGTNICSSSVKNPSRASTDKVSWIGFRVARRPSSTPTPAPHNDQQPQTVSVTVNGATFKFIAMSGESYAMHQTEITQSQWQKIMGNTPDTSECAASDSFVEGDNLPVSCVTWESANKFAKKLTKMANDGYKYRLPSSDEWLAAAGTAQGTQYGWCSQDYAQEVGKTAPMNGLFDTAGNVSEITRTTNKKAPERHLVLGGSYKYGDNPRICSSLAEYSIRDNEKVAWIGFRIVRSEK